jgi:ATP-dependent helicase STH1/SNF2
MASAPQLGGGGGGSWAADGQADTSVQPGMAAGPARPRQPRGSAPTRWAGPPVSDAQMAVLREQVRQYQQIMHAQSQNTMQQPVPPPDARYRCEDLPLAELKVERERISRGYREAALQLLLQDPNPSVQTQIRIKQLQLLPLQHQVRNELRSIFERNHGADAILQWFEGKKRFQTEVERGLKRAAKARADEAKRQTKITRSFFEDMFKHGDEMRSRVKKSKVTARKERTKVDKWHNDRVRDDKKLQDKRQRERIQALRDNDEEKYLALLKNEKNERLNHLMNETEAHLKLLTQKMQLSAPEGTKPIREPDDGSTPRTAGQRFHQAAHSAQEKITEQPKKLVGGDLKSYQIEGLNWTVSLYNNGLNGILADEMGLGKTIQTIALITYLMEQKDNPGPYLVVVPLSVMPNWRLELEKWAPSVKLVVFKGPDATRKRIYKEEMADFQFNVVLTTYEYIMKGKAQLGKFPWQYIIIDEGHRIKNADSKLAVMLGHKYKSKNRLLLTGTPLQNNLSELWALLNFLLPQVFNSSASFESWFNEPMAKLSATGGESQSALDEEETLIIVNRLHSILKPFMLRRMKKDVESQLPQKSEVVLKVELSGWQKLVYKQLKNEGLRSVDADGNTVNKQMQNVMMQLRKTCNHPYLFWQEGEGLDFPSENLYRSSGKFEMLDRMLPKLRATGHKVLIFTQMTKILDLMEDFLSWRRWNFVRLDGATKAEERGLIVEQFADKSADNWIFLLTTRAGGVGLNLQVADTVIIFDSDWNPQMDMQAMDRAHRIGQKSEVRVYRMITNTQIEEDIFSRAKAKKNVNEIVVRETNEDETDRQTRLRKLLEEENEDGSGEEEAAEETGVMSWEECNNILARSEDELALFEKMDKEMVEKDEAVWNSRQTDGQKKPWPGRLMSDKELPAWMLSSGGGTDTAGGGTEAAGGASNGQGTEPEVLGPRKRERVSYKPQSDQEFNRMLSAKDPSKGKGGAARKRAKSGKAEVDPRMKEALLGIWKVVADTSFSGLFTKLPVKRECVSTSTCLRFCDLASYLSPAAPLEFRAAPATNVVHAPTAAGCRTIFSSLSHRSR